MQQLRCLYFEDKDDDYVFYEHYFRRALANLADLDMERAKTPEEAYRQLDSRGKDLNLFFADLLVKESVAEGLRLVEYVTRKFSHVVVIGISETDGSDLETSGRFEKIAGPDSVIFDKSALKSPEYAHQGVLNEIAAVALRKGHLLPSGLNVSLGPITAKYDVTQLTPRPEIDIGAKYIFLDIVGFTQNRPVEAQADVIKRLNVIVSETIGECDISSESRIFLPTGDGICIVLLRIDDPVDINMQIALKILERLNDYNNGMIDETRRFQLRIGIESGDDILIRDINDRRNIAGDGINMAARIMDLADGSQILLGERAYGSLHPREKYRNKFRDYIAIVKHERQLAVHQFVGESAGLSTDAPLRLATI